MKKIGTKQIVPLVLAAFAVVFAVVGFTSWGSGRMWTGTQPGFFHGHHGDCHVPGQHGFLLPVPEGREGR